MERKFNCTKEQAMVYDYITKMEEKLGRRAELPEDLKIINEGIREGLCDGVVLVGPTGSGKLGYAKLMAKKLNAPVFQLSLTSNTHLEDFYRSQIFSEPIEKGGFLIIEGMEFCHRSIEEWLETWLLCTLAGQKLVKPKLDDLLDIPEYIMSPNFVLVLVLDPDYLKQRIYRMSVGWFTKYPTFAVHGKVRMERGEE